MDDIDDTDEGRWKRQGAATWPKRSRNNDQLSVDSETQIKTPAELGKVMVR